MKADNKDRILNEFLQKEDFIEKYEIYRNIDEKQAFGRFCRRVGLANRQISRRRKASYPRLVRATIGIAASLILLIGGWNLYLLTQESRHRQAYELVASVGPGRECAYLTTDKGRVVTLAEGGLSVDTLRELREDNVKEDAVSTITVPRGGEYKVVLPDGTTVHLNAESSLSFPNRFSTGMREVTLSGEAYFEVAHDEARPFIVHMDDISVKQYGTHFNIKAYGQEPAEVTLLEGSIGVTAGLRPEYMLRPGQQARIDGKDITICKADRETVMGWTEGMFRFENESLDEIAEVLSRWYDVDIKADDGIGGYRFTGSLMRDKRLADILDAINEITGTTYSVKDNTIKIHK